jgi:hypothetical protein
LSESLEKQKQEEKVNVEQDWQNIKAAILEAAKENTPTPHLNGPMYSLI